LTNGYPNKNKKKNNNNNKVKSKPLELFELAGKKNRSEFFQVDQRSKLFRLWPHNPSRRFPGYLEY
jgi:hypothetical protein